MSGTKSIRYITQRLISLKTKLRKVVSLILAVRAIV